MTARMYAVRSLIKVENGGYSNLVIDGVLSRLNDVDAAFCTALFYTTLERRITIDFVLSRLLKKSLSTLDIEILTILRTGLCQIIYLDSVPDYAAIDESVKMCRALKKASAASLVNAVLRKASLFDLDIAVIGLGEIERLSVIHSLDPELTEMFLSQYGEQSESIFDGLFKRLPQAIRVNTLKGSMTKIKEMLEAEGIEIVPTVLPGCFRVKGRSIAGSGLHKNGYIHIQSYSSQAAVHALAPKRRDLVVDLCAAPGGKTLLAAQLMENEGRIVAFDRHENRLNLLKDRALLENVRIVECVAADSSCFLDEYLGKVDCVIADVPCSGYGDINEKPELRYKKPAAGDLIEIQRKILSNGAKYLKKGGRLLYSTCTLNKCENDEVVKSFLSNNEGYYIDKEIKPAGFIKEPEGYLRKLPSENDGEGFFMTVINRAE